MQVGLAATAGFWSELRLPDLQQQLDVAGLQIAEAQESAAKNRRMLADATRVFKKQAPEASHKVCCGPTFCFVCSGESLLSTHRLIEHCTSLTMLVPKVPFRSEACKCLND